jgi:hypothetical protein
MKLGGPGRRSVNLAAYLEQQGWTRAARSERAEVITISVRVSTADFAGRARAATRCSWRILLRDAILSLWESAPALLAPHRSRCGTRRGTGPRRRTSRSGHAGSSPTWWTTCTRPGQSWGI